MYILKSKIAPALERHGFLYHFLVYVPESILIWNNDKRLKFFKAQTQIQDLWANKDSALHHVMGSWSALIGRWKSWIVICDLGFQDLQLANKSSVKYQLFNKTLPEAQRTQGIESIT